MPDKIDPADRIRLQHMLNAAHEALEFSKGRDRSSLDVDAMYRRALVSCMQEIGEAAVRVSPSTRQLASDLPWNQIVGMRHRLVHVYFAINNDLVWEVVARDLEPLVQKLEVVLTANK